MGRVFLKTDVHCTGCEKKIRKFLGKMDGVDYVWASYQTNEVEVGGSADAEDLRRRLATKLRRPVTIETYGQFGAGVDDDASAPASSAPSPAPRTPASPASPPNYPAPSPPPSNDGYNYPPSNNANYYYPSPPPPPSNDGYYYPQSNYSNYYYPAPPPPPSNNGYYYQPSNEGNYYSAPPPPPSNGGYSYTPYGPDGSLATFSDENPNACSVQ